jgi:hypothetical protein
VNPLTATPKETLYGTVTKSRHLFGELCIKAAKALQEAMELHRNVVGQRVLTSCPRPQFPRNHDPRILRPKRRHLPALRLRQKRQSLLCNDSDGEYEQVFGSREELQRFVDHLMAVADEAWDEYCEASLDLSNQDDVGEAGAIAALDDLYANNDEGMKRLADS